MYDEDIKIYENRQSTNRLWNSALIFLISVYVIQGLFQLNVPLLSLFINILVNVFHSYLTVKNTTFPKNLILSRYGFKVGRSEAETYWNINLVFGKYSASERMIKQNFMEFKLGWNIQ